VRKTLYQHVLDLLDERHVDLTRMAQIAYESQLPYEPDITLEKCKQAILHVLEKREVQNVVLTGIVVDKMVDQGLIPDEYLVKILKNDENQYQCDELLSTGCVDVFGGVASSNRGYLDKEKPGIIGEVDRRKDSCNVFLDDLMSAIISSAESYIANKEPQGIYREMEE
jgi:phosphatidylglycerophosphatase A